jgi:Ni/Co efflux regulator RcnB
MKKIIASLVAASFALVSFQAFAQDASAPAATSAAKPKHTHKQLKTHGKKAHVSEAASAAGTNDKGTQN